MFIYDPYFIRRIFHKTVKLFDGRCEVLVELIKLETHEPLSVNWRIVAVNHFDTHGSLLR